MNRYLNAAEPVAEKLTPVSGRQLSEATIAIATLLALGLLGFATSGVRLPVPDVYAILALFVPAIVNGATSFILLNMYRVPTISKPIFYLALVYAASSIFSVALTLAQPNSHSADGVFNEPHSWLWTAAIAQIYFAASAFVYVVLRHREIELVTPSARFIAVSIFGNLAAVGLCLFGGGMLHDSIAPPHFLAATLSLAAFGLLLALPKRTLIDVALSLAMLAFAIALLLEAFVAIPFSGAWYVEQLLRLLSSAFVLVAGGRTMSETRGQILLLSDSIAESRRVLERNALRLNSLWYVASHGTGNHQQRYQALLDTATAALRPGSSTFGYVSHLVDDDIRVDSSYASALLPAEAAVAGEVLFPGALLPLKTTIERHLLSSDRSAAWTNFSQLPAAGMAWERLGWLRVIGSSFSVGATKYFVVFGSMNEYADTEFTEDDFTYVDVLAAFIAGRLQQEEQLERIRFQIEHDALTGLHTRTQFRLAVRKAVALGNPFAIAALDLDHFKAINDEAGTMVADELLVEVASSLDRIDDDDIAARLGADEFGVLLCHRRNEQRTQARLGQYFEVFKTSFSTGLTEDTRRLGVTASVGSASFPEDGQTEHELMQRVSIALAESKAKGGDRISAFERSMESIVDRQRLLASEIRDALVRNQFELEYQPTVSLATGVIQGAEALIRWNHPTRGRVLPDAFIPFSEQNGLSIEIGRWVMARALHDIMSLTNLPPAFRCYVNISAPGLEDEAFVTNIRTDMALYPGAVDHFGIEVTEGTAMLNAERAIVSLGALRRLGLRVAIDDFGTGYSSLSYLKRLPIDILKLDRSFIMGLPNEPADVALTETLLAMASRFRLTTLAEGVESIVQAQWLADHGCELGQGFAFSRSIPIEALQALLTSETPFRVSESPINPSSTQRPALSG